MPYKTVAALDRLGTESAFEVLARAQALAAQGKSIISLSIGQPDFPTPPHIVEAAVKALRDGQHGYTAANGILALREAIAADLNRRHGVSVNPGQIVAVPGGKVTMAFAVMLFGEPGAEILYPDPGFPIYRSLIDWTGAKGVPVPLYEKDGFAFTAEAALSRLTDKTRLMIFNTPANPTGGVTPKEELDKLVKGLERFPNVAIMADEIYSEMLYDGLQHHSLLRYPEIADRVILLDGFSKTFAMTGWRLGYGVWPGKLAEAATRLAININSCVNAATQFAGITALTGPRAEIDAMMVAFDKRRRLVHRELNAMPGFSCILPKGAFYAFPNIAKTGMSAKEMERGLLEEAGVASIAGTSFGAEGEGFLRISYANSEANILEACGRIRAFLGNRPR